MFNRNPSSPLKVVEKLTDNYRKIIDQCPLGYMGVRFSEELSSVLEDTFQYFNSFPERNSFVLKGPDPHLTKGHNGYTISNNPHRLFDLPVLFDRGPISGIKPLNWTDFLGGGLFFLNYFEGDFRLSIEPLPNRPLDSLCMLYIRGGDSFKKYVDISPKGGGLEELQVKKSSFKWRGDILLPVYNKESFDELTYSSSQAQKKLQTECKLEVVKKELDKLDDILTDHLEKINY